MEVKYRVGGLEDISL
jgi:hypothetical protein